MNITHRPLVQDLVKQAMANATQRAQIAAEGARQMKLAEEKCPGCDDPSCDCNKKDEKKASAVSTEYALKLAAALDYAVPSIVQLSKQAAPNMPPPHMTEKVQTSSAGVTASDVPGTMPGPGQQGKGHAQPPMNPGTQKAMPQEHGATQLDNTMDEAVPGTQTTAMSGGQGKTASALYARNLSALKKVAASGALSGVKSAADRKKGRELTADEATMALLSGGIAGRYGAEKAVRAGHGASEGMMRGSLGTTGGMLAGGLAGGMAGHAVHPALALPAGLAAGALGGYGGYRLATSKYDDAKEASAQLVEGLLATIKQAEDAINPAQISAGPAVAPETDEDGQSLGAPAGGLPQGPRGLVGSNESAINYKKQTAYSPRKSELAQYFNEPALSAATDKTLNEAFANTAEAGAKIASAQLVKSAAARALLSKLATETH